MLRQGIWAILLTVAGTALILIATAGRRLAACLPRILDAWPKLNETPLYDVLYTYVIFGANIFYMLAIASVFVLRAKPRPAPAVPDLGLPVHPPALLVAAAAAAGQHAGRDQSRVQSLAGLGIILLGLPAYFLLRRPEGTPRSRAPMPDHHST